MTREEAKHIVDVAFSVPQAVRRDGEDRTYHEDEIREAKNMAIQALSQEPCELLIIKSDILLHQDDRKKWMESIKREKESGVIILPPYFEPLLVPANIEINIEQEPCDDVVSRDMALEKMADYVASGYADSVKDFEEYSRIICQLPSVTQKSGKWHRKYDRIVNDLFWECDKCGCGYQHEYNFCPNCGAKMVEPQESEE